MVRHSTLKGFLASARTALLTPAPQRHGPLTFVVGNESADLDSLCCALVYAYIRTNTPPHTMHIPLANITRPDLSLRTEMSAVLKYADLSTRDLLTLSELPDLDPEDTTWYLVDHNCLTGPLKKFSGRMAGVIDHHTDEEAVHTEAEPRVVEPCGSCMSLVVEESRSAWAQAVDPTEETSIAKLALAAILTDTVNLTAEAKIKPKDRSAVEFLRSKISEEGFDSTAFHHEIDLVKHDISALGFRDIFRKDYKEWEESGLKLGVSCVVQNFDYLISKADSKETLLQDFAEWAEERKLDIAAIMTTSNPDGEFQRHLLVWGRNEKGEAVLQKFEKLATEKFELESWKGGELDDGRRRMAWRQKDLAASRKQVAPLLREAMKS